MATITVYGFITDSVFFNKTLVDLNESINQGVGYLTDKQINHFVKVGKLNDVRVTRLPILGQPVDGKCNILFDKTKILNASLFEGLTSIQLTRIFNIAETIYLSQNKSEADIEALIGSTASEYTGYVAKSLKTSIDNTIVKITIDTPTDVMIKNWIEFSFSANGNNIVFHLWLGSKSFIDMYPLSTISRVVPPCDPAAFLNPSSFTNILDTIVKSNMYTFNVLSSEIKVEDHTGYLTHLTKYIQSSTVSYTMPFGILYKGAKPSSLEIRKAIREYLIGLSIVQEDVWKMLFPDLFVTAQFFVIPIWNNTTTRPDRIVYPSVIRFNKIIEDSYRLFISMGQDYISRRMEIIMNGKSEIFSAIIPDPLNESEEGFLQRHPTYTYHHRQDSGFEYQELKTQQFNDDFNACMSILFGDALNDGYYSENIFDDRKFLSFVVDEVEYHVLYKEGFL